MSRATEWKLARGATALRDGGVHFSVWAPKAIRRRAPERRPRSRAASFAWTDHAWRGRPLSEFVIYELHVGTFTDDAPFGGESRTRIEGRNVILAPFTAVAFRGSDAGTPST